MTDYTQENLLRLMAAAGLSVEQVTEKTGVDKRTIRAILNASHRPHPRTLHRLAEGLRVSIDEFFVDPSRLLYRRFDRQTNPVIAEVVENHQELFAHWTEADFDELHSRVASGGPLLTEGALVAVRDMNRKRALMEELSLLLETGYAELIAGIIELFYAKAVVSPR
jgi:transcriptional regulator with XRE-family HTH domain